MLRTQRLVLRSLMLEDAPRVQELAGTPEVSGGTLTIPYPYPDGAAEVWILSVIGKEKSTPSRTWAIEMSGEFVGAISLNVDEENKIAEIGYWLGVPYWGKGIITEAGLAVVKYGFEELGLEKIYGRHFVPTPFRLPILIFNFGGVYWTKFETISSKIQMIKNTNADSAGRNNLSGEKDSPCLG